MRLLPTLSLLIAVSAGALVGCKGSCRQLAEKLCDCAVSTIEREACLTHAQSLESQNPPTDEDNRACAELVDQCDCHQIDTAEGKQRCGLAR